MKLAPINTYLKKDVNVFGDVSTSCQLLALKDTALAHALKIIGAPHIRKRKGGFASLFKIIVAQQVSVPSAEAIWKRCIKGVVPMSAKQVLTMNEDALRELGLTRQKANYVYALAQMVTARRFSFARIKKLDDEKALRYLQTLKGIGPWSAAIYLLFCEGRVDLWPPGDIALEHAYGHAKGLKEKPGSTSVNQQALQWAPWRGLAAHILWTYYAHIKGRPPQ